MDDVVPEENINPVHKHDGEWWYWLEERRHGPYSSEFKASKEYVLAWEQLWIDRYSFGQED